MNHLPEKERQQQNEDDGSRESFIQLVSVNDQDSEHEWRRDKDDQRLPCTYEYTEERKEQRGNVADENYCDVHIGPDSEDKYLEYHYGPEPSEQPPRHYPRC